MEKKEILLFGVFGGIGFAFVPRIFLDGAIVTVLKYVGYLFIFGSVLFFIAGDAILNRKKNAKNKGLSDLQLHKKEMQKMKLELEKQRMKNKIQQEKTKIENLKKVTKSKSEKLPDVLGNLSDIMGSSNSKKKKDNDLKDLF